MLTLKEKIAVMQACADGKEIEVKNDWEEWMICKTPIWDWIHNDYRVKPEPPKKKTVPYKSAEEFLQAMKEHGPMIEDDSMFHTPITVGNKGIATSYDSYNYIELLGKCTWQDGTNCGKVVEIENT